MAEHSRSCRGRGAGVALPQHQAVEDSENENLTAGDDDPIAVFIPVWICTDPDAAGLRDRYTNGQPAGGPGATNNADHDETVREAKRVERRRGIANNAAWRSAEAVRREWLAGFVTRKTPPAGAEALVCAALVTGDHLFTRAMQDGHRLLCTLLDKPAEQTEGYYTTDAIRARLADQPSTPKADQAALTPHLHPVQVGAQLDPRRPHIIGGIQSPEQNPEEIANERAADHGG